MAFKEKKITKWTNDDVVDWIKSLNLRNPAAVIQSIKDCKCTGKDWFSLKKRDDVKEALEVKPMIATRLWKEFGKIKDKQIANAVNKQHHNTPNTEPINDDEKFFELNMFGQSKFWEIKEKVTVDTTIRTVKQIYKDESGVKSEIDNIILIHKAKQYSVESDHKTLGDIGIKNDKHLFSVLFDTPGGMAFQPRDNERERVIYFKKYGLKRSHKPDCLIGYDDDDDIDRADIGCRRRHAMAAETMYSYIVQSLEKNIKAVTISCPNCKTVLDWDKCTQIADMSGKEYAKWTRVIEKRLAGETKTCPHCSADCKKKEGVIIFRMNCSACEGVDWCWNCLKPWRGGGLIYCSNRNCSLIKDVNKTLDQAPMIIPEYLKNVKIPSIRACPMCLTFIRHQEGCKHMTCIGCTGKFCFVCLGKWDKETDKWPCNSHTFECEPAPVQVFN